MSLSGFLELRRSLEASGWREGADRELADRLTEAIAEVAADPPPGTAVVATGGFGRGSLALRSDVDLMILHRGEPPRELAGRVLRPLWDAGLKVGHSVRTPADARGFAGTRLDALCLYLTARVVVGEAELVTELHRALAGLVEREYGLICERLVTEEARRRDAEPRRLQAADLKIGRGGQRTLDLLEWRRRIDRVVGLEPVPTTSGEEEAASTLVAARSALHAAAGRAVEVFSLELRDPAAAWLGLDAAELGHRILRAQRLAEAAADARWPELRRAGPASVPQPRDPGLRVVARAVRRNLERPELPSLPARPFRWHPADREALMGLTRPELAPAVWTLVHSGWLDAALPDLAALIDVPHLAAYHRHPAFDHSLETVAELDRILDGDDQLAAARRHVPDTAALRWAALLHDVGKAVDPDDHARAGAPVAREVALGVGLDPGSAELVGRLTGLHLDLAHLATRADLEDPSVRAEVAERVGDLPTLASLYLLTAADSLAAGTDLWRPWRAESVTAAYHWLAAELAGDAEAAVGRAAVAAAVLEVDPSLSREEVLSHLAGLGEGYRRSHPPEVIALHVALAGRPAGPGGACVGRAEAAGATRVAVVAPDRAGLLASLCGALALERLSILDARVATRTDGLAFDTFLVVDGLSGEAPADLSGLERILSRVLAGGYDLEGAVREKQRSYRPLERPGIGPRLSVHRHRDGGGVVEVETADRLGLAFDLANTLHRLGLPIQRARLDTRAGVAHDVVWLRRLPVDTSVVEEALASVL